MISQRTFTPKVFQVKLGIALSSVVMLVPIGIFTKSILDGKAHFLQPMFLSFLVFFLVFTLSTMRNLSKQLKSGISVSDQGLWPSHLRPESSLVPWQKVPESPSDHVAIGVLELAFCMWLAMLTSLALEVERSSLTLRYLL